MISKEEQIEEMGMTLALLESDLLDYKTQVETLQKNASYWNDEHSKQTERGDKLQKEVERLEGFITKLQDVHEIEKARLRSEVSHDPL